MIYIYTHTRCFRKNDIILKCLNDCHIHMSWCSPDLTSCDFFLWGLCKRTGLWQILFYAMLSQFSFITLAKWVECLPMAWEIRVQFQAESYQRLKKWYLIQPCLMLSIRRCISRVKWSNPGKGVAPSPTPQSSSYWKRSLLVTLDYGHQLN